MRTRDMATRITEALVKGLEAPAKGNNITYDTDVKGFGVRVTAGGARAFVLNYRAGGRERRYTIGSHPDWSTAAAKQEAKELKKEIEQNHGISHSFNLALALIACSSTAWA